MSGCRRPGGPSPVHPVDPEALLLHQAERSEQVGQGPGGGHTDRSGASFAGLGRPARSYACAWATVAQQIAGRLREDFPDDPEMWVSTETIYQSLYVQFRGALRRDVARCLRTRRALRVPNRQANQRRNRIPTMVNIVERPPEVADPAVPGHWEGDLIIGRANATAIATLVERTSGYTMLVQLPHGYNPSRSPQP